MPPTAPPPDGAPAAQRKLAGAPPAAAAVVATLARRLDRATATRVHGRWVLLDSFMAQHPGGPVALSLAAGRDATVLFESYHPLSSREKMAAVLDKHAATAASLAAGTPPSAGRCGAVGGISSSLIRAIESEGRGG
jgi:hypothetical protein